MICESCGTPNEAGRKFCKECAAPLSVACASCGSANAADAKFCGECAAPLAAAAGSPGSAADPRQAPAAERRLVSVLFADLVGFTPFSEGRDPEEVREMLTRWFELGSEIIGRYGGVVEKFIGDAVMAVWGAPTAHEDDAERAVRASLEIVEAVRTLGDGIQARAGVLTGEAAVTLGATNQGLVAGDLVNTAARLQSAATPGSVLVGEATFRAASRAIAFEEAGEQVLKGKASPVPAWHALRVVAERGGRNRTDVLEPPFVGRDDELRLVKDLLHATGREQRIRLVSVMGPAGIGKSRLAREFSKYTDGLVENVYYHTGRSPSYGDGITFWALGEMVRGRCGLLESDDEATTREKVAATVAQWVTDEAERRWIEPALLTLLGIESEAGSEQLFAAWRTFFERIAAQGTVALIFEDFHFADTGLIDFVDHLLDWSRGVPIYVITLSRPELLQKRPDWGAGKRNFVALTLEPLPEPAMRELLAGLVPGLPDRAVRAIVERAGGVPLYAVETVRMLVAEGRLKEEDGSYVPVGDLTELAVPDTLVALIGARLDALELADRSLLQDASVLGQSFTLAALSAVSGVEVADLEPRLIAFVRRELLTREVDPRSPEHGQFAFVQALIREVAYGTLAKSDRKVRHLASARYFEALGTDELAGALASHYLAAHANAADGAEADALAAQARIALKGAAERAASLGAFDQAVLFLEQALTVARDAAERAELLERAGEAAYTAGHYDRAVDLLRDAGAAYREANDRLAAARVVAPQADALNDGVSSELAKELTESALQEFADLAPDPVLLQIRTRLARAFLESNQPARALEVAEQVLETAETGDHLGVAVPALVIKGAALAMAGRKREGIALIRAGADIAREKGLHQMHLGALIVAGYQMGDLDPIASLAYYREALALAERLGYRNRMFRTLNNIGYTEFLTGNWDEALSLMEEALELELDDVDHITLLCNALIVRASRGEPIAEGVEEAERIIARRDETYWRVPLLDTLATAALAEGRLDEAREHWHKLTEADPQTSEFTYRAARGAVWARDLAAAREDLATLDSLGIHGGTADARGTTLRAAVAALEGRMADALSLYREALRAWREMNQTWDEVLTVIDMVTLLDPEIPEVAKAAQTSREMLVRLGARPFLARLDAELSRGGRAEPAGREAVTEDGKRVAERPA